MMMKRALVWIVLAALLLSGCGGKTVDGVSVALGNATVTMGSAVAQDQLAALGEPQDVQEAPSCHYEGMDTVRQYDGVSLQTYRQDDADILCVVMISSDAYATDKGVKVGDTAQSVQDAYGAPVEDAEYYVVYDAAADVSLTFELDGDIVTAILYELKA